MKADDIISRVRDLPAPATSVVKLSQRLARLEASAEDVIEILRGDGVLCAKILAVCNSAAFGFAGRIGSIEHAVLMLGFQEVQRLVLALGFGGPLRRPLSGYAIESQELWRHSLITAHAVEWILDSGCARIADPSVAYTAGLIHDIGKIALNQVLEPGVQQRIRDLIEGGSRSRLEAERAVLETDHAEVGASLLRRWKLPDVIVEAVANHHAPVVLPQPQLSALVHLANMTAHQVGSAPGWDGFAVRAEESVAEALGFGADHLAKVLIRAVEGIPHIEEMMKVA